MKILINKNHMADNIDKKTNLYCANFVHKFWTRNPCMIPFNRIWSLVQSYLPRRTCNLRLDHFWPSSLLLSDMSCQEKLQGKSILTLEFLNSRFILKHILYLTNDKVWLFCPCLFSFFYRQLIEQEVVLYVYGSSFANTKG